jgi:CHAD domain-containing protein
MSSAKTKCITMPIGQKEVRASMGKLRKALKKRSKRLAPADVHTLRARIKRFESLDSALSLSSNCKSKRLSRPLRQIRKKAGRARDMDVLTSHLAAVHSEIEQSCLIQLVRIPRSKTLSSYKKGGIASQDILT